EPRVQDVAVLKLDGLKQRAAQSHDVGTLDLVAQIVGIDHGATLEGRNHAQDMKVSSFLIEVDFNAGSDVSALFKSAAHSDTMSGRFLLTPAELPGSRFEHGAQAIVRQILQAEFQRIHVQRMSDFIRKGFEV